MSRLSPDPPRGLGRHLGPLRLRLPHTLLAFDLLAYLCTAVVLQPERSVYLSRVVITFGVFWCLRLYRRRMALQVLDDVPHMLGAIGVGHLASVTTEGVAAFGQAHVEAVTTSAVLFLALLTSRLAAFRLAKHLRCGGPVRDLALIIGAGHVGIQLGESLQRHGELGLAPVGYIDSNPRITEGKRLPAPLLGTYDDLAAVIDDFNVSHVLVAYGAAREDALVDILRTCDRMDVDVLIVPRLFELHNVTRDTDDVWGIPLLRVRRAAFRSPWWRVKRFTDILVAGFALVVLSPVLLACAVAVRYEGGPGVIFRQVRVGLDQRPFDVLKFRSLRPATQDESQTRWNIRHDARMGRVGSFLRRSSLDELPQLWNILRGDMSLVGPRPERPFFVDQFSGYVPRYTARHRVPAGLTGWAQVHGLRGDTSIEDRARFDNYYIENWSLWLDAKIVCRTVLQVLQRQGG